MTAKNTPGAPSTPARHVAPFFAPLQRELDRVISEFGSFEMPDLFAPSPRMDLRETDGGIELTVELPGLSEQDVQVELEDDLLTVSGEKKSTSEESGKGFRSIERRYGSFSRSVRLPAGVQPDQVKASLKAGVLTVTAPRGAADTGRKVAIPIKAD